MAKNLEDTDTQAPDRPEKEHLFDRPANVKRLLLAFYIGCAIVFGLDALFFFGVFDKHAYYQVENWPGFYSVYGFLSCVILVLVPKYVLRPLVMRREDYYDD